MRFFSGEGQVRQAPVPGMIRAVAAVRLLLAASAFIAAGIAGSAAGQRVVAAVPAVEAPAQDSKAPTQDSKEPALAALTYKAAGDELRTRIVIMFNEEPTVSTLLLDDPSRLVIDLPETVFAFDKKSLSPVGLVTGVRYGLMNRGRSRLILALKGPFAVENLVVLKNETDVGYRLVVDVVATSRDSFDEALAAQNQSLEKTAAAPGDPPAPRPSGKHGFTVVVDPGHGGIDSGAQGVNGTLEKNVVLAVAQQLRDILANDDRIHVVMTRDSDVFLSLAERVRIAREVGADLFMSIHADSIHVASLRGATVYTISDKASDAVAQQTADSENLADSVAGVPLENEPPEVADILMDLTLRETHNFSVQFADDIVQTLDAGGITMINRPHRSAGFRVLKAPDVPSVLVELGYLSNAKDEKLLTDEAWRARAAGDLAKAVREFAAMKPRTGG
jgi:N-acetylmuramoyl-L-alanine amidase